MLKRFVSFALILTLVLPVFFAREAEALATSNYTKEPYAFKQAGSQYSSTSGISAQEKYVPSNPGSMPQSSNDNASWAYAAIAALNAAANKSASAVKKTFSIMDLVSATSNKVSGNSLGFDRAFNGPGNRTMLTTYLMRGMYGGPNPVNVGNIGGSASSTSTMQQVKPTQIASGVVYIPDQPVTADAATKKIFRDRIKNAIRDAGAVAASVYLDPTDLMDISSINDPVIAATTFAYHNNTLRSVKEADHTIAIIGWDDTMVLNYKYSVTTGTGDNAKTVERTVNTKGAFLVYDSINVDGEPYWMSYDTVLSGVYFIEGFYNTTGTDADKFALQTPARSGTTEVKNPLEVTYEYDAFGQTGALGYGANTAWFANVFTTKNKGEALQAVSVFLTGEGNTVDIYYVADYKNTDTLKDIESNGVKVVDGVRKDLPGYYTIPVASKPLLAAQGKKFAIVAVVTCTNGTSPVPIQSTSLASAATGRSYMSSDGSTWTDTYGQGQAAVCLKAHAEKDVDVKLQNVYLPQSEKEEDVDHDNDPTTATVKENVKQYTPSSVISGTSEGAEGGQYRLLETTPGLSYAIGPILDPANANDVLTAKTKWYAYMEYAERDADGYLVVTEDVDSEGNGKGTYTISTKTDWVVWNATWGMFLPVDYDDLYGDTKPTIKMNVALVTDKDGEEVEKAIDSYKEQPISLSGAETASCTLKASKEEDYFGDYILLKVVVSVGQIGSDGKFVQTNTTPKDDVVVGTKSAYTVVKLTAVGIEEIKLDKSTYSMKAGGTVTLKATLTPSDASARKVTWCVAQGYDKTATGNPYTNYSQAFNPADPYNSAGPVATVSDAGKVTAVSNGSCYVYAKIEQDGGTIFSPPCKITIAKADPTGISLNKKKMTISAGTYLTLTATVKPTNASNKQVRWSSSDTSVVEVDAASGIMLAKVAGTATITAADIKGNKAECVITVTAGPSAVVRKGKSATYSVLGAASSATVEWEWVEQRPEEEDTDSAFSGAASGSSKYKVTASSLGFAVLDAIVTSPAYTIEGSIDPNADPIPIRHQSWNLASTVAISKMQFRGEADEEGNPGEIVKKLTLCIGMSGSKPDASTAQSVTLKAEAAKPSDATLLDFVWDSKKPEVAKVTAESGTHNEVITITATGPGSTKITGTNYNGNKKIGITVKVLLYPTAITVKATNIDLYVGKSASVKGKAEGKGIFKDLQYTLTDKDGNVLGEDSEIAYLDAKKGKITAIGVGEVYVIIKAAPYGTSKTATVKIKVKITEKPSK